MEAVLSKPLSPICDDGCFAFVDVGDAQTKALHPEELLRLTAMEAVLSKPLSPICDDGCFAFVDVGAQAIRCEIRRLMSLVSYVNHNSYHLDSLSSIIVAETKVLQPEELLRLTAMEAVLSKTLSPICDDGCYIFCEDSLHFIADHPLILCLVSK
eukprot:scaffold771_cov74-Skeletonema_marinoi.AAC.2